jgi:putative transport protein
MQGLLGALAGVPLAALMIVIAAGFTLGRVRLRGLSLGPAGGTLFAGLLLGRAGLAADAAGEGRLSLVAALGFALFLYAVGFDAAPHFFASFRERRGWRCLGVAVAVNAVALAAAVLAGRGLGLSGSATAGLLAGALTSAPTFAAAAEIAPEPTALALAFALAYPLGLVGVVLAVQVLPGLLGEDLARGAASDGEMQRLAVPHGVAERGAPELSRAYRVESEGALGRSLRNLRLTSATGCVIARMRRGDDVFVPTADTVLERGDRALAVGRVEELRAFERLVGPEEFDAGLAAPPHPPRRIEVRHAAVVGRPLSELGLIDRHRCVVTRIERGRLWLEPDGSVVLAPGDVLEVSGERDALRAVAREVGRFETGFRHTDVAVYAGGIALGLLVGAVRIPVAGFPVGLGFAGGLLVAGLVLGSRPRIGPLRTHVPFEARQLVRDLGILLFVGEAGLRAGGRLAATGLDDAVPIVACGALVTGLSLLLPLAFARRLLRLRPLELWGSLAGGLTSSAALHAVREAADSNEPAISYAAAYALASVLAAVAGPLAVLMVGGG